MTRDVLACPDCPTALEVRSWVLGEELWTMLAVAVVPTALTLLALWVIHRVLVRADRVEEPE
jgi:hypothetical protein